MGLTVIVQGTLNRQIAESWGLSAAVLLNASIFFITSLGLLLLAKFGGELVPEFLKIKSAQDFKWWYALPGLCGFLLVLGLPWGIRELGASKTFVLLVSSQIVLGLIWDTFVYNAHPGLTKMCGAGLAILGAIISIL